VFLYCGLCAESFPQSAQDQNITSPTPCLELDVLVELLPISKRSNFSFDLRTFGIPKVRCGTDADGLPPEEEKPWPHTE